MLEKYAVVDIEATGGTQKVDRIIEIAIVLIDGDKITETYSSLVNPIIGIPPFIIKLTGINNTMVRDAPHFHEIAKTIVEMTEGRSLVAHNVSFDYRILREEFKRLGYEFKSDTLCTARLSKHYFPDIEKHNLASVAKSLNLEIADRHRAGDDAMATAEVMLHILGKSRNEGHALKNMKIYRRKSRLPFNMEEEDILDLPNVCGVYYMLDADKEPLYIGKSIKIRSRIRSHFSEESIKSEKMQKMVHSLRYENTGSEIMSEVHESLEIRKYKPLLNKAKRKTRFDSALLVTELNGYRTFEVRHRSKLKQQHEPLQWFSSRNSTKAYIAGLVQRHELCACLAGMNTKSRDCTTYKIGQCHGAFLSIEDKDIYNMRFAEAEVMAGKLFDEDMVILDIGRNAQEYTCFYISDHKVSHVGHLPKDNIFSNKEALIKQLKPIVGNPEIDRIVYRYFYLGKYEKRIKLSEDVTAN